MGFRDKKTQCFVLPGPLKTKISNGLYFLVVVSFLVMQAVAEWRVRKIRSASSALNDVVAKTGVLTFFVVVIAAVNVVPRLVFPEASASPHFWLANDLGSCVLAFVVVPIAAIVTNKTLSNSAKRRMTSLMNFKCAESFRHSFKALFRIKNSVFPVIE